jgi:hypothetical protein
MDKTNIELNDRVEVQDSKVSISFYLSDQHIEYLKWLYQNVDTESTNYIGEERYVIVKVVDDILEDLVAWNLIAYARYTNYTQLVTTNWGIKVY